MSANPDSMLPRILQSCSITMYRKTLHFMVIENIFFAPDGGVVRPSAVYDIKVRPDMIRIARMGVVGKFQSCLASELWI